MSSLAIAPDPLPTNLPVSITVDSGGAVVTEPYTLQIPQNFDGTITWTVTGASFLNPGLTFGGQTPPSFVLSRTSTSVVRRWGNTLPGVGAYSYYYTLHMVMPDGTPITYDPTVENIPPTT